MRKSQPYKDEDSSDGNSRYKGREAGLLDLLEQQEDHGVGVLSTGQDWQ